jgi:hypothetical protein
MDNMTHHHDDRLANKTYVWGVSFGVDAVWWIDDFVIEQGNVVNAEAGGHPIIAAWPPREESLGVWYNNSGVSVTAIDFLGKMPSGLLIETNGIVLSLSPPLANAQSPVAFFGCDPSFFRTNFSRAASSIGFTENSDTLKK